MVQSIQDQALREIDQVLEKYNLSLRISCRLPKGELVTPENFIAYPLVISLAVKNDGNTKGPQAGPDDHIENSPQHGANNSVTNNQRPSTLVQGDAKRE